MDQTNIIKQQLFLTDVPAGTGFSYYKISKSMLSYGKTLGISTDEVLLYTLLKDRVSLSYKNQNYDSNGNIYIYCTRKSASEYLGWSLRKTVDVFKSLVSHHLLDEVSTCNKKGKQTATKLYVRLWTEPSFSFSMDDLKSLAFPRVTMENLPAHNFGDYYILPKALLEAPVYHDLSHRAVLLYMLLLDRIQLSMRYHRQDENGFLWTTLDSETTMRELGCRQHSLTRAYRELEELGLIVRQAVNYSEKWRIYLRDFSAISSVTKSEDSFFCSSDSKSAPLCHQICTPVLPDLHPCVAKSAPPELPNLHPINHSPNNPSFLKPSLTTSIPMPASAGTDALTPDQKREIDFNDYRFTMLSMDICHYSETSELILSSMEDQDSDRALDILEYSGKIIKEMLECSRPYQILGKESVPTGTVLDRYQELDEFIMYLTVKKILPHWADIKDKRAYLRRTLYLAGRQHRQEAYYLRQELQNGALAAKFQGTQYVQTARLGS